MIEREKAKYSKTLYDYIFLNEMKIVKMYTEVQAHVLITKPMFHHWAINSLFECYNVLVKFKRKNLDVVFF